MAVTVFFSPKEASGRTGDIIFGFKDLTEVFKVDGFPAVPDAALAGALTFDFRAAAESFSLFICSTHFDWIASAKFFTNV
jgi:hypothetical protein